MLDLADRVSKRARLSDHEEAILSAARAKASVPACVEESCCVHHQQQACASLNLATALHAATLTRELREAKVGGHIQAVDSSRSCIKLGAKGVEETGLPVPGTSVEEKRLSLSINEKKLVLGALETQTHSPISTRDLSWDDLEVRGLTHESSPLKVSEPTRKLFYHSDDMSKVLISARNASRGLESALLKWDPVAMIFQVMDAPLKLRSYLLHFAETGSWIRRVEEAAVAIRALSANRDTRVALALTAAISKQVSAFRDEQESSYESNGFVQLYLASAGTHRTSRVLAELVGCADLTMPGRLARIPPAKAILDRIYRRALLLQSSRSSSRIIMELMRACIDPWLSQLNFVCGLSDLAIIRAASFEIKQAFFPEIFIDIDDASDAVFLVDDEIPCFIPSSVASAALNCYQHLMQLGFSKHYMASRVRSETIGPLNGTYFQNVQESSQWSLVREDAEFLSADLVSGQSAQLATVLGRRRPRIPGSESDNADEVSQTPPGLLDNNLNNLLGSILERERELGLIVKREFLPDLRLFRDVIVGLFFLNNGWLWSQLLDPLAIVFNEDESSRDLWTAVRQIHELVSGKYEDVEITMGTDGKRRRLVIAYEPPTIIKTLLPDSFMGRCTSIFMRIIYMQIEGRIADLAGYTSELEQVIHEIDGALGAPSRGIDSVVSAFLKTPN